MAFDFVKELENIHAGNVTSLCVYQDKLFIKIFFYMTKYNGLCLSLLTIKILKILKRKTVA